MSIDTHHLKIIPADKARKYLSALGVSEMQFSNYTIKSGGGWVYLLPNGEVALLPSSLNLKYPAIIFRNLDQFKYYENLDVFPIGEENMTWAERYRNQIVAFRTDPAFYADSLQLVGIKVPFENVDDIRLAFLQLQKYTEKNTRFTYSQLEENAIYSFGLAVTDYLIDYHGYRLRFEHQHATYNPIVNVLIEKNGSVKDVPTSALILLDVKKPEMASIFLRGMDLLD